MPPGDIIQEQILSQNPVAVLDSILYSTPFIILQVVSFLLIVSLFIFYIHLMFKGEIVQFRSAIYKEALTKAPAVSKGKVTSKWSLIQKRISSNDEAQWKVAILEADAVLDNLLIVLGYQGNTMGERMENIKPGHFTYLDEAWRAHKVRNFIAHDPSYTLSKEIAERVVEVYRKIFDEFNILN